MPNIDCDQNAESLVLVGLVGKLGKRMWRESEGLRLNRQVLEDKYKRNVLYTISMFLKA